MPDTIEHVVRTARGAVRAIEHAGAGAAFVMMHGFPDNLHIYDGLAPLLAAAGRRVVCFDFLGFGRSDKPEAAAYSFAQQLSDLEAVIDHLALERVVPVSHDAAGPAALNYALAHPNRTESVVLLNSAYAELPAAIWPELITLFATPALREYGAALLRDPEQFRWLVTFQRDRFRRHLPERHRRRYDDVLNPLIDANFAGGAIPAFVAMTGDFFAELRRNREQLPRVRASDIPITMIWGESDPYLGVDLAEELRAQLGRATLQVLPGGHWVQFDEPRAVAAAMLARG